MKRFKLVAGRYKAYYYILSLLGGSWFKTSFDGVTNYVVFVGYPRSGHSLVGSLLDAHPETLISNQLNALHFFKQKYTREQIFYLIKKNARDHSLKGRTNSGYDYHIEGQWQGKFENLKVIGDKRGGRSSAIIEELGIDFLKEVEKTAQAKVKIIHVIRNPFDNLSTMNLRQVKRNGAQLNQDLFEQKFNLYESKLKVNKQIFEKMENDVCHVHLENLISSPQGELTKVCKFLNLKEDEPYLEKCSSVIWPKTNKSRNNYSLWNEENILSVKQLIDKYDFLNKYTFDN